MEVLETRERMVLSTSQIADKVGAARRTVNTRLTDLEDEGKVVRQQVGRAAAWHLPGESPGNVFAEPGREEPTTNELSKSIRRIAALGAISALCFVSVFTVLAVEVAGFRILSPFGDAGALAVVGVAFIGALTGGATLGEVLRILVFKDTLGMFLDDGDDED